MSKKSKIMEAEKFAIARNLETANEFAQAIKAYQSVLKKNPLHTGATSRLLILYRKEKNIQAELSLLKDSIKSHENHIEQEKREWISEHKKIAEDSRPLAKMLGMLGPNELPNYEDEIIQKWQRRLNALEKRIKTKAIKKSTAKQTKARKTPVKDKPLKKVNQSK